MSSRVTTPQGLEKSKQISEDDRRAIEQMQTTDRYITQVEKFYM